MAGMVVVQDKNVAAHSGDPDAQQVRAAQHDIRAFAPLYEAYFDRIYRYCLRSLRDPELAADATSETFIKALKALPRYRSRSFRSWLFTIAHNVIVDTVRRRRPATSLDTIGPLSDHAPTPEEAYVAREAAGPVADALTRLPDKQRDIVELRIAGLSGQEIAEVLGMSVGAVRVAQFRAYSRLRELLRPHADDQTQETTHGTH
jgi:RNA polymerase sigma-70 factor (ECF subfamily)